MWLELTIKDHPAAGAGERVTLNVGPMDVLRAEEGGGCGLWKEGWEAPMTFCESYAYVQERLGAIKLPLNHEPEVTPAIAPEGHERRLVLLRKDSPHACEDCGYALLHVDAEGVSCPDCGWSRDRFPRS